MRNVISVFLFGGLMLCRAVCGHPVDLVGPPSFSLSYEGVSSSDLNLSSGSEGQIDVLASGSSAWGLVHALWLPESHQAAVLTWESDWTIDVDLRNSVTVTNGGTFFDEDGDTEYVNQAQMWVALHAQNPYVSSTSWYDEAFLEFGFYNNNGQLKGIKSENELTDAEAYQALSTNTAVKMRAAYSASNQLIEVSYSLDGADYTLLQTVDVSSLQDQGLYIALGAESDNVAISAGQNYFTNFTVTGVPVWELYDDFSVSALDTQKWESWYLPGGTEPSVVDGQLFIENGNGGDVRKPVAFESTLAAAGIGFERGDLFNTGYATGITFTGSSIIGVEAELSLPANSAKGSGVMIELFEQVSATEIAMAVVSLEVYANQPSLNFYQLPIVNGEFGQPSSSGSSAALGEFYRLRLVRQGGTIQMYRGDTLMATHVAQGELIGFSILASNYYEPSMSATIDNVRVLLDSDGDGLSDSVEANLGTNPQLEDSSGDGFTDGEAVSSGLDPNVDYSSLLAIVRDNPERFNANMQDLRIGAEIASVVNGEALLHIVLEESVDLTNWSERTTIPVSVSLEAGEITKFFRYAMKGAVEASATVEAAADDTVVTDDATVVTSPNIAN